MLERLLIYLIVLAFEINCLLNKTDSTDPLPLFSSVLFQKDYIFYISSSRNSFGYIQKASGLQTLKFQLQSVQKLISFSSNDVEVSTGDRVIQYHIQSRNSGKTSFLHPQNINIYSGYQRFTYGFYILADNRLVLNQWKAPQQLLEQIVLNLNANQTVNQMQIFGDNVVLLTRNIDNFCVMEIQRLTIKNKKCLQLGGSGEPRLQVSGKSVFIVYSNNLQLLDESFQLVETFTENPLQIGKGFASFNNFRSYNISSKAFENCKIVSHNSQSGKNKLQLISGEYILKQDQNTIAKIPNIISQPKTIWLNKRQAALGRVLGKYQLLVQFNTGSTNFYEIKADPSGSNVVLKWSK